MTSDRESMEVTGEKVGELKQESFLGDEQEGKSLDELAGEGHIATPGGIETGPQEGEKTPMTEEEIMKPVDFKEGIFGMRGDIELVKSKVMNWMEHPEFVAIPINQGEEIRANLMLAYRHLEDSRMRLGKAIQAYDGGKSCYPR